MRRSPVAKRVSATPSQVPRVKWKNTTSAKLLESMVRFYGLPMEINGESKVGFANWGHEELEFPFEKIELRDSAWPLTMIVNGSFLSAHKTLEELKWLWPSVDIQRGRQNKEDQIEIIGSDEVEMLTAITCALCHDIGIMQCDVYEVRDMKSKADGSQSGHKYVENLLFYVCANEKDLECEKYGKSLEDFRDWVRE